MPVWPRIEQVCVMTKTMTVTQKERGTKSNTQVKTYKC